MASRIAPCPSAKRFQSLLVAHGRTNAELLEQLGALSFPKKEIRNVGNFLKGTSRSASPGVRVLLIKYAREQLNEKIDMSFFEEVPSYLQFTQAFQANNCQHASLIQAHCGWFQSFMLEASDLERAIKGDHSAPLIFRDRELKILLAGDGSFAFEMGKGGGTCGFAMATHDTIHLVGYEQKHSESVTYMCLMASPQRLGLQGVTLCGIHVGPAKETKGIPVRRAVARRIALVSKQPGAAPLPLHESAIAWLTAQQSREGSNAGLVVDLSSGLSEDAE